MEKGVRMLDVSTCDPHLLPHMGATCGYLPQKWNKTLFESGGGKRTQSLGDE